MMENLKGVIYEQTKDNICVASECMSVRWLKPTSVEELKFVSQDVLLIHAGKMLIFYNVITRKENILIVSGNELLVPSVGDGKLVTLPLDGIVCVGCCGADLLALAEQPPISKVVVCRYPDLKVLVTLVDDSSPYSAGVKSMSFVKTEYLIGLRDYPAHDLIVWLWRIGEKLFAIKTGFIQPNQSLSVSDDGRDLLLSVVERGVTSRLQLWRVFVGGRLAHAQDTPVDLPSGVDVGTCCWAPGESGGGRWFVFCDSSANVYRARPATAIASTAEMCVENTATGDGGGAAPRPALLCPGPRGFVLHAAERLMGFNEVNGVFTKVWTIIVGCMWRSVVLAGDNDFYGWSDEGTLLKRTKNTELMLHYYGNNIKYFVFVKPTDQTVATVNEQNVLQVWDVSTGEFRCEMKLNGIATNLCSNPLYYYVAITFENGKVELVKTDPNVELIAKIMLCDEKLSSVNFFCDGKECLVTYFPTGRFYHIKVELGIKCSVVKEFHLEKEVIDAKIFDDKQSSFLIVLYRENEDIVEVDGNNFKIFNKNFDIVFNSFETQYFYTSIFKWISLDVPGTITIGFTVSMSFDIHLITVNMIDEKLLRLKSIPIDHDVRAIKIYSWKNHCITFCEDGTYNLYEYDVNDHLKKIIKVNCSHWQTGGLIVAEVDGSSRSILTLSRDGNFICTSFKETCYHPRRDHQIDTPIITKNMKTKGIGFEDEAGSPNRMTWTMIKQNNEFNAHIERKNRISEEFEKLKMEMLILYEENMNGPEDERLNKEEFYIDDDEYGLWFIKKNAIGQDEYETKIIRDTEICKIKTENIIKEHWDPLIVKPKSIHCIESLYKVDNYSISIEDQEVIEKSTRIIEKRSPLNLQFSKDKYKGSISHELVDTIECLNSQCDYYKLDMAGDEIILLQFVIYKLKIKFNKLFDDMFVEKQRVLDELNGFNNKLRVIEAEFRLACKIESTAPLPVDYKWSQYEQTERLLYVEDDEVAIKVNDLSLDDKKLTHASDDSNGQSRKVEKFRKQALIYMMDGVLQKRWEDELKKDVPKPHCMLNIKPEDYTVGDLKAINKYEEAVVALNNDRMKYKIILEEEKTEIDQDIRKSIDNLDNNIKNLFEIKIKYDSAINQEYLKTIRLSKMLSDSDQRKQQIKLLENDCLKIEKTLTELDEKIKNVESTIIDLNTILTTLTNTANKLQAQFISMFSKKKLIAYKWRPKMLKNLDYSSLVGHQFVDTIMNPTDDKVNLLGPTFVKYLNTLEEYDNYDNANNKRFMDNEKWLNFCYLRRLKIINEFEIINCQKDVMDVTNFSENLQQDLNNHNATMKKLKTSIEELKNQDLIYRDKPEIQLILQKGNTDIELTGHIGDFDNVLLTEKNVWLELKSKIEEKESIKASKLPDLLKLKRKCQTLKSDINIKKQEIILYKHRCEVIKHMTVTKNMLYYQELKEKGIDMVKHAKQELDKKRAAVKFAYNKQEQRLEKQQTKLAEEIKKITKENKKLDNDMDKTIAAWNKMNDDVIEHSQMITKIQVLREDIVILENQLKSLQLKVFPESQ